MFYRVEKIFDEQVRPGLASHGGGVEIVDIDNGKLFLRLKGGCQGCASSTATLRDGIRKIVLANFPEINDIVDVTDHTSGENPYYKTSN